MSEIEHKGIGGERKLADETIKRVYGTEENGWVPEDPMILRRKLQEYFEKPAESITQIQKIYEELGLNKEPESRVDRIRAGLEEVYKDGQEKVAGKSKVTRREGGWEVETPTNKMGSAQILFIFTDREYKNPLLCALLCQAIIESLSGTLEVKISDLMDSVVGELDNLHKRVEQVKKHQQMADQVKETLALQDQITEKNESKDEVKKDNKTDFAKALNLLIKVAAKEQRLLCRERKNLGKSVIDSPDPDIEKVYEIWERTLDDSGLLNPLEKLKENSDDKKSDDKVSLQGKIGLEEKINILLHIMAAEQIRICGDRAQDGMSIFTSPHPQYSKILNIWDGELRSRGYSNPLDDAKGKNR